mmetsp:Transcript_38024/g.98175  ORF Transcript_38024/g.98175 Transcript_38024/m.98175 type:complete len:129 (+) Transcript_38024:316-702(+)
MLDTCRYPDSALVYTITLAYLYMYSIVAYVHTCMHTRWHIPPSFTLSSFFTPPLIFVCVSSLLFSLFCCCFQLCTKYKAKCKWVVCVNVGAGEDGIGRKGARAVRGGRWISEESPQFRHTPTPFCALV